MLERFGTVEVDFSSWNPDHASILAMQAHASRAIPLAAAVADHAHFELADQLGFRLFAGPFIATPTVTAVRQVPVDHLGTLVALTRLQRQEASLEELEHVINSDRGLSVKLLRYINSAYFGMRPNIASIHQAVMMLGAAWGLRLGAAGRADRWPELAARVVRSCRCPTMPRRRCCTIPGTGELFPRP